jgi:amidase
VTADPLGALVPGWEPPPESRTGPLEGLRVVVKDVIDVAGAVSGGGNPDWAAHHPDIGNHVVIYANSRRHYGNRG